MKHHLGSDAVGKILRRKYGFGTALGFYRNFPEGRVLSCGSLG